MTFVIAEPEMMASVATEIDGIGSALSAANAAAAGPTSGLAAAAADEVSAAVADVFGGFGREYQSVVAQLEAFNAEFQQTLAAAGTAYAETEAAIAATLGFPTAAPPAALPAATIPPFPANLTSIFVGPTGVPIPPQAYVTAANNLYVRSMNALQTLFTPEQLYPITGVKSSTLNSSVAEGLTILDNELMAQISATNSVTVFGYSQSAIIASLEMRNLAAGTSIFGATPPTASELNFVLVGNEMNPNGGMLARFPNLTIPSLGLSFYGATPSDTIYPTAIYTAEYDGFADFPRYPLNFVSDLNAVLGIATVHVKYLDFTPAMVNNAVQLPTSPGYSGATSYYAIHTDELPLLAPLRAIPVIGNPLAHLIEPDLRVIVNLGYGDPNYGYSTSPADVPTPFGLFPDVAPGTVFNALAAGTQQGIHDFTADLQAISAQPLTLPSFAPPAPTDLTATLAHLPSPQKIVNTLTTVVSDDYAVLLPTADTGLSFVTTLPLYDTELFLSQLGQGNLVNAIGYPIAADVGLGTIAGMVELLTITKAVAGNISDIRSLIP
jgi:hypothetical protein